MAIPLQNPVAFEPELAEAGFDVELVELRAATPLPGDLTLAAVMELLEEKSYRSASSATATYQGR